MTNTFVDAFANEDYDATTLTENGMVAYKHTSDKVLDFFGMAASARGKNTVSTFAGAVAQNEDLALRALLWLRDVRGGAGERKQFRDLLSYLDSTMPGVARKIMHMVPVLGRWDDLFAYTDAGNRKAALRMYADAIMAGNLLAVKWAPREKSAKSEVANELRKELDLSKRDYRKLLSGLSAVVENQMCAKDWKNIDFSKVPSVAAFRYQKAFSRNAANEYSAYIAELQKPQEERDPKVKINAGAVFPHDVVMSLVNGKAAVANEQWKALPNYVDNTKTLPVVDVSGSMGCCDTRNGVPQPMLVSISLGLYLSDKNTGPFKDMFVTFSEIPKMVTVKGTLEQKVRQIAGSEWGYNTDLEKVFDLILSTARKNDVSPADMPDNVLILSDMQFDQACYQNDNSIQMIRRKYESTGYAMPKIIFWNLQNYGYLRASPVKFDSNGTALISGFSPSIMKAVLADDLEDFTPLNVMLQTLLDKRYDY